MPVVLFIFGLMTFTVLCTGFYQVGKKVLSWFE